MATAPPKRSVLIADADEAAAAALSKLVEELGLTPVLAKTAAEVMERADKGVDVLFLDLKVAPDLDGPALLSEVREKLPKLPVVACAADGQRADVLLAWRKGCVDWLDKPAERDAVTEALKRAAAEVRRHAAQELVAPAHSSRVVISLISSRIKEGSLALPEMPRVVDELRKVLVDQTAPADAILKVLEKDPALAARIIATANTATYGGRGRVTDLKSAITRLGNRTISNIAQTAALRAMFTFRSPVFKQVFLKMWTSQLVAACLAREIAIEAGDVDAEEVYLLSLLHNAGEPFLLRVFAEIVQRQTNQVISMEEILIAIRDYHAAFGSGLVKKWNMGAHFEIAARRHHDADYAAIEDLEPRHQKMMHIVNAADRLIEERGLGPYHHEQLPGPTATASFEAVQVRPERRTDFLERVLVLRDELSALGA